MHYIFKSLYTPINHDGDVYDEKHSIKALYDDSSSEISSTETITLPNKRTPAYGYLVVVLNLTLFFLSSILFLVSGYRYTELGGYLNNDILRKSSEHCKVPFLSAVMSSLAKD